MKSPVPKPKRRSSVWRHFTSGNHPDTGDRTGTCHHCNKSLSIKSGNVSNLVRHLRNKHPSVEYAPSDSVLVLEETPKELITDVKENNSEVEIARSYRLRWSNRSELRNARRLRNENFRSKIYHENTLDSHHQVIEDERMIPEDTQQTTTRQTNNDDDSDRHFLLSLLPLMKRLSAEDNMDVRIMIQKTFKDKLFPRIENVVVMEEVVDDGLRECT